MPSLLIIDWPEGSEVEENDKIPAGTAVGKNILESTSFSFYGALRLWKFDSEMLHLDADFANEP